MNRTTAAAAAELATFRLRMRERRLDLGLSQLELAHAARLSPAMAGALERGHRLPSLAQTVSIAAALGTTVGAMLDEAPATGEVSAHLADDVLEVLHRYGYARAALRLRSTSTSTDTEAGAA